MSISCPSPRILMSELPITDGRESDDAKVCVDWLPDVSLGPPAIPSVTQPKIMSTKHKHNI